MRVTPGNQHAVGEPRERGPQSSLPRATSSEVSSVGRDRNTGPRPATETAYNPLLGEVQAGGNGAGVGQGDGQKVAKKQGKTVVTDFLFFSFWEDERGFQNQSLVYAPRYRPAWTGLQDSRHAPPIDPGPLAPLNLRVRNATHLWNATHWWLTCALKSGHSAQGPSSAGTCPAGRWELAPPGLTPHPPLGGLPPVTLCPHDRRPLSARAAPPP